jgi:HAD superfamily hydrolase (TIGR01549 family)
VTRAVFFDVDFTLIYPGPTFRGEGYRRFCEKHCVEVDPSRFEAAVVEASALLDVAQDAAYRPDIFINYTSRIIEAMGGRGPGVDASSREIYNEWAVCHHFELYEDVAETFRHLVARGLRLGLISNTHRALDEFQTHFALEGLVNAAISSFEHGFLKPHPSIFEAALRQMDVPAREAVMVGDSFKHDIEGALSVGMSGVLLQRSGEPLRNEAASAARDVPVIRSLRELPSLLDARGC